MQFTCWKHHINKRSINCKQSLPKVGLTLYSLDQTLIKPSCIDFWQDSRLPHRHCQVTLQDRSILYNKSCTYSVYQSRKKCFLCLSYNPSFEGLFRSFLHSTVLDSFVSFLTKVLFSFLLIFTLCIFFLQKGRESKFNKSFLHCLKHTMHNEDFKTCSWFRKTMTKILQDNYTDTKAFLINIARIWISVPHIPIHEWLFLIIWQHLKC